MKGFLEEKFNLEVREDCKFRMTKNDYVILSDELNDWSGLEKLKNIIMLVNKKEEKYIWNLVNQYHMVDIIDSNCDEKYILHRIEKIVGV